MPLAVSNAKPNTLVWGGFFFVNAKFIMWQKVILHYSLRYTLVYKIAILLLTAIYFTGYAQIQSKEGLQFGAKLGLSWHNATGGITKVPVSASFLGGIWMRVKLSHRWTGQPEVIFTEKGGGNIDHDDLRFGQYSVKLFYLEMPLLFQYHWKKAIFEIGPSAGVRTYQYEVLARTYPANLSPYYPFKPAELSVNLGVRYAINSRWSLDMRLCHSVISVRDEIAGLSGKMYNRVVAFSVNRRFGGRES